MTHAFCALITYAASCEQPQNSTPPIIIHYSDQAVLRSSPENLSYFNKAVFRDRFWVGQYWDQQWDSQMHLQALITVLVFTSCTLTSDAIHVAS